MNTILKSKLKAKRISQVKAAEALGISRQHFSRIMAGKSPLNIDQAQILARMCGLSVALVYLEPSPGQIAAELATNGCFISLTINKSTN